MTQTTMNEQEQNQNTPMLDKWAVNFFDRRILCDFLNWLEAQHDGRTMLIDINFDKELDKYHGINQRQLESERRGLIDSLQSY